MNEMKNLNSVTQINDAKGPFGQAALMGTLCVLENWEMSPLSLRSLENVHKSQHPKNIRPSVIGTKGVQMRRSNLEVHREEKSLQRKVLRWRGHLN